MWGQDFVLPPGFCPAFRNGREERRLESRRQDEILPHLYAGPVIPMWGQDFVLPPGFCPASRNGREERRLESRRQDEIPAPLPCRSSSFYYGAFRR
jgi:hypothetical protein